MIFGREPVLVTTFVSALLVLLVTFGINLPDGFEIALNGAIVAGAALFARSRVTPVVDHHVDDLPFVE